MRAPTRSATTTASDPPRSPADCVARRLVRYSAYMRALIAIALLLAPITAARAIPPPRIPTLAPPTLEGALTVSAHHVELDCRALASRGHCLATVSIAISGSGVVTVEHAPGELAALRLDGRTVQVPAPPLDLEPIALSIHEGEHTLVVTRRVLPSQELGREWLVPACEARHLLLHRGRPAASRTLAVQLVDPPHRAARHTFELRVLADRDLALRPVPYAADPPWSETDGARVLRLEDPADTAGSTRLVAFDDPGEVFHHGGPMLGIGARLNGDGSFRVRLEYEVAFAEWILPGLSVDADLVTGWTITPRVEVATPVVLVLPSLSFGVGVPIQLEPDPDVGLRLLVGLAFGPAGISASFDLFPSDDGVAVESAIMARISL